MIVENKFTNLTTRAIKADKDLLAEIYDLTSSCEKNISVPERIYLIKNGLSEPPHCPNGNKKKFKDGWLGYQFCGRVKSCPCAAESQRTKISASKQAMTIDDIESSNLKRKATVRELYGVDYIGQDKDAQKKREATCVERYGATTNLVCENTKEKIKQTNLSKYGSVFPMENETVKSKVIDTKREKYGEHWSKLEREKSHATMIERYGVSHALQHPSFQKKRLDTNLERWGDSNHMKNDVILTKIKQINQNRYGADFALSAQEVRDKIQKTCLERYGFDHIGKSPEIKSKVETTNKSNHGDRWNFQQHITPLGLSVYENSELFIELFNKHDLEWLVENTGYSIYTLHTKAFQLGLISRPISKGQKEISDFIKSLDLEVIDNDRSLIKPKEIDIWIPSKKVGLEYCGIYWHSDLFKDKFYHRDKMIKFLPHGRLITIFENEWRDRRLQAEGMIRSILGKNIVIGARKCDIALLPTSDATEFMDKYHLQGAPPICSVNYGLLLNGEIVAVMAFVKRSQYCWELARFCSINNITGGASRLLNAFKKAQHWESIVSFADLRWSSGDLYFKLGFQLDKTISIDYQYTKRGIVSHKFNHRKKHYKDQYDISAMTESQIMISEGWARIWDCGKLRFIQHK